MLVCGSSLKRDLSSRTDGSGVAPPDYRSVHTVHGPVYFRALDDAGFFAVNSLVEDVFVLTASFNVNLFRPMKSGDNESPWQGRHGVKEPVCCRSNTDGQ